MSQEISATMNEYLPLRDVVFQTLRQAILRGELEPGERLMEIHLADRLGVSRTPIREAIRKLELEGLVVMIPRRGAIVASITEKDLKDVLEVRRTLEIMAAEIACDRITPELLQDLAEAGEEFRYIRLFSWGGPLVLTRCAAVQKALKGLHVDGLSGRQALQRHADGRRVGLAENRQVQVLTVLAHRAPPFRAEKSFQKSG